MVRRVEFLVITAWAFMCHAGISAATTNECDAVDSAGEAIKKNNAIGTLIAFDGCHSLGDCRFVAAV